MLNQEGKKKKEASVMNTMEDIPEGFRLCKQTDLVLFWR